MTTQVMAPKTDYSKRAGHIRLALRMAEEAQLIGGRIKELRSAQDLTQRDLAERLPGKTEGKDISRWENGHHRPGPDTLSKIAEALGTTVADLHAGPVADRKDQGPTPDPFATASGEDQDVVGRIELQLRELLAGQLELTAKVSRVERLLEDQQKQQQPVSPRREGKGTK